MHHYAFEFAGRHNLRGLDTLDQMARLILGENGWRGRLTKGSDGARVGDLKTGPAFWQESTEHERLPSRETAQS